MGFPPGWTEATGQRFRADDLDSLRYHALGNAVTPPVAEWLANRINAYLAQRNVPALNGVSRRIFEKEHLKVQLLA
jgi:DNA (cytosine-5)-methyltransferase 1